MILILLLLIFCLPLSAIQLNNQLESSVDTWQQELLSEDEYISKNVELIETTNQLIEKIHSQQIAIHQSTKEFIELKNTLKQSNYWLIKSNHLSQQFHYFDSLEKEYIKNSDEQCYTTYQLLTELHTLHSTVCKNIENLSQLKNDSRHSDIFQDLPNYFPQLKVNSSTTVNSLITSIEEKYIRNNQIVDLLKSLSSSVAKQDSLKRKSPEKRTKINRPKKKQRTVCK